MGFVIAMPEVRVEAGVTGGELSPHWTLAVDRGGTFTDWVLVGPDGARQQGKVPSRRPDGSAEGLPWATLEQALRQADVVSGERGAVAWSRVQVRLGTTVATNLLLEGAGNPPLLVTTAGFEDVLELGDGTRPSLFDHHQGPPAPLTTDVLGLTVRRLADGRVDAPLDLREVPGQGRGPAAVSLVHGVVSPEDEVAVAERLSAAGFSPVICGHAILPRVGFRRRTEAAVLEAWLWSGTRAALDAMTDTTPAVAAQQVQRSDGGIEDHDAVAASHLIMSGPAGGVLALEAVGRRHGCREVVGLDMGGTTTDVSRWEEGVAPVLHETMVDGRAIPVPMLPVHSIASGGGSRLGWAGGRPTVGPGSSGASPGPACYGRGGPPSLADALLVAGRLVPELVPASFGPHGNRRLDPVAAAAAVQGLEPGRPVSQVAAGYLELAVAQMAEAVRAVTVREGHDVRGHTLVAFGGAGPQVATLLADRLGIGTVLIPGGAGVLSAAGIAAARGLERQATVLEVPLAEVTAADLAGWKERLAPEGPASGRTRRWFATVRQRDRRSEEVLDADPFATLATRWLALHERRHGYAPAAHELVLARLEVVDQGPTPVEAARPAATDAATRPPPDPAFFVGRTEPRVPCWHAASLAEGSRVVGPGVIGAPEHTLVIDAGWEARLIGGDWRLTRLDVRPAPAPPASLEAWASDALALEVLDRRLAGLCAEMGLTLERTARSVNIAERRDLSCGVFDVEGRLLANAAHIPVHLGAMGRSVRALLETRGRTAAGDWDWPEGLVLATNDPLHGGSHRPDITVVAPVHVAGRLRWLVASRAHHADIGGLEPGSLSPVAISADDEGLLLHATVVGRGARPDLAAVEQMAVAGPHPVRHVDQLLADLEAQVAAARLGMDRVAALAAELGDDALDAGGAALLDRAERVLRERLRAWSGRTFRACDVFDDGTPIALMMSVDDRGGVRLDFTGTGGSKSNLHAPRAVVEAAAIHALRSLVTEPISLNGGCLAAIDLVLPPGSLLDPPPAAAVAGGNVETSQRLVDLILRAVGAMADGCGSMSNLALGDREFGFYETLPGGGGARPAGGPLGAAGAAGLSARQVHMTNTRGSDVEVLERAHPLLVRAQQRRVGSGGAGRWPGGDGLLRTLEVTRPLRASLVTERRRWPAPGLSGGLAGAVGRTRIHRRDGTIERVAGSATFDLDAGDRLSVATPGGGGAGAPADPGVT